MFKYIGCLDFEANCLEGKTLYPQEIIEFPVVVYDVERNLIDRSRDFHYYCRTSLPITKFCTSLTHITQEMTEGGLEFDRVLHEFGRWMNDNGFNNENFLLTTCGSWDLDTCLPNYLKYLGIKAPSYLRRWNNIKETHRIIQGSKISGMDNLLKFYGLKFEGHPHSGIDDAYNLARVVQKIYNSGYELKVNESLK